ncbi:hypothetical protein V492_02847 [Pseudogymnoascus sp. VKM F-4246]|nr:hypothetical protein V492_02847 [Pseudogymnoascus sp. VKM F-4246]
MSPSIVADELDIDNIPKSIEEYRVIYEKSIKDPESFWAVKARKLLDWERDFKTIHTGNFKDGDNAWFQEGRLNASYNCIDRHAIQDPNKVAVVFEADEVGNGRKITYGQLLHDTSRLSYVLKDLGVKKGEIVCIYLPNIYEALVAMLACSRIGAVHSVVFMGFSAAALRDRILDGRSKIVITADEGRRGGKAVPTKAIVNEALLQCPQVTSCLVLKHTGSSVPWCPTRDVWWHEEARQWPAYIAPESMSAEDPLFLLYTSGSTGKPKGLMHTTAGFLLGANITTKYVFDMQKTDVHFCAGDIGWITGHTYLVYGPLLVGATTVVFEGTPAYPTFSRYWDIAEEHRVTHFYAAPTALRILKRAGDSHIAAPMENLRVLGSIGEPIAPEVWKWYHETVGRKRAYIVDTYFQTETGCHVISPLVGSIPTKPGCCTVPFLGIEPVILDPISGQELEGPAEGLLAIKRPWPSMARTVWRAHERYLDTYFNEFPGYYFTGDGAFRDEDGYYWIRGRVDDVVNVSGHRLSTAEIEASLLESQYVAESAAVGVKDEISGQAVVAYVSLKDTNTDTATISAALIQQVRKDIGAFAAPKALYFVSDLPKTRSGKIVRRVLRSILEGETENFGDTSTLLNPTAIPSIIKIVQEKLNLPPAPAVQDPSTVIEDGPKEEFMMFESVIEIPDAEIQSKE